ncbi:unnamed protein product, partial [Gadus morhua 'NCC']
MCVFVCLFALLCGQTGVARATDRGSACCQAPRQTDTRPPVSGRERETEMVTGHGGN